MYETKEEEIGEKGKTQREGGRGWQTTEQNGKKFTSALYSDRSSRR
jgi:hypothetical protein